MDGIHQFTKYQLNMAVKIRLARRGRKKLAIYDVVVADAKAPRDGRFIEKIGTYNPNTDPASININNERALTWLMNGAQPTDTVKAMLSYRGVLLKKHLQIGVLKGAISQEDADAKFETWKSSKENAISGKVDKLTQAKDEARKKAQEAEAAKNQARLDALKKKEDEAKAAAQPEVVEAAAESESPEVAATETESPEAAATETESPEAAATETESPEAAATETESPEAAAAETETPKAAAGGESTEA
jgi:small subunit ribosomal protein S16